MRRSFALCVMVSSMFMSACATQPHGGDAAALYEHAQRACVEVLVGGRSSGSGWFCDHEGNIITAAHVVYAKTDKIEILSPTVGRREAKLVATDLGHDIAMIHVVGLDRNPDMMASGPAMPKPGETVYLYGAANFRHDLMIAGTVARPEPIYEYTHTQKRYTRCYHISAPSPPGTSGGCWFDATGRVVGNQSGFMTVRDAGAGIALVAAPDAIARLVQTQQTVPVVTTGCAFEEIWAQTTGYIKRYPPGAQGLVPVLIEDKGPAKSANVTGDMLITAVDGKTIAYIADLLDILYAHQPGDTIKLAITEADTHTQREITLTLARE